MRKFYYYIVAFWSSLFSFAVFPPFKDNIHTGVLLDYTALFSSYPIQNGWLDAMAATLEPESGTSDEKRLAGRLNVFKKFTPDTYVKDDGYLGYASSGIFVGGPNIFPRSICIGIRGIDFNGSQVYAWAGTWPLCCDKDSLWQANSGPLTSVAGYIENILAPKLTLIEGIMCGAWSSVPTNMINSSYANDGRGVLVDASETFNEANAKYIAPGYLSCRNSSVFGSSNCYTYLVTFFPGSLDPDNYWWFYRELLYVNNELKYSVQPGQYSKTDTIDELRKSCFDNTKFANKMRFDSSKNCHILNTFFSIYWKWASLFYRVFNSSGSILRSVTYADLANHSFFANQPETLDLRLIDNNGTLIPTILVSAKKGLSLCSIAQNGTLITDASYFVDYINKSKAQFIDYTYSIDASYANYDTYKNLNGNRYIICAISYPEGTLNDSGVNVGNKLIFVISKCAIDNDNKLILSTKARYEYINEGNYCSVIDDCGKLISFDIKNNHLWITYMTSYPEYKYKYFHMDARALIESAEQKN